MLLTVDVGNTQTTAALFDKDTLRTTWRFPTLRQETADGLAAHLYSLFAMNNLSFGDVFGLALASVVPSQQGAWRELAAGRQWAFFALCGNRCESAKCCGIEIAIAHPEEVGADRLANAAAAAALYPLPAIVVDFGTATTFDCVGAPGRYLGGAILPGLTISLDALSSRTAKLPRIDLTLPQKNVVGGSTVEAIHSGLLHGTASLTEGMVERIRKELSWEKPTILLTGGLAKTIAPYIGLKTVVEPLLTLHGIRIMHASIAAGENV